MDRRAFLATAGACCLATASARPALAQTGPGFADAIAFNAERGGASLLVARHGIVVAEDYPGGGRAGERWPLGAGTRALAPLLAASLAEDRLLNLDEAAALSLPEWAPHPVKNSISVRALLSGTSGLAFGPRDRRDFNAALALEPVEAPGLRFADDSAAYILLTELARRKLLAAGRDPDPARYLTSRTLGPICAAPIGWTRSPDGAPRFDDGAAMSARGWAAVGELIRREGVWRGQQLVDERIARDAQRGSFAEARAGFGLWLAAPSRNRGEAPPIDSDLWRGSSPAPIDLAMAAGAQGQRLYLSRTEGLVIVRQTRERASWSDAQFLTLVWRGLS
jgi:Beta-lactamase